VVRIKGIFFFIFLVLADAETGEGRKEKSAGALVVLDRVAQPLSLPRKRLAARQTGRGDHCKRAHEERR
jgi:hypothetical protein